MKQPTEARPAATRSVLLRALEDFGVSKYQLGEIIGKGRNPGPYRWFKDDESYRPSGLFLVRILLLYQLHRDGILIGNIQSIDWERGEIIYRQKRGHDAIHPNHVPTVEPALPAGIGAARREPLAQPPAQANTQPPSPRYLRKEQARAV